MLQIRDVLFHFFISDPDPNIFHPGSFIKKRDESKNTVFHASYGFRKKSLKVKKITHTGSGKISSRIRISNTGFTSGT
jgi:hypothetical protein